MILELFQTREGFKKEHDKAHRRAELGLAAHDSGSTIGDIEDMLGIDKYHFGAINTEHKRHFTSRSEERASHKRADARLEKRFGSVSQQTVFERGMATLKRIF